MLKTISKYCATIVLIVALFAGLCAMGNAPVRASAAPDAAEETEESKDPEELQKLVDAFLAQLKAKYGEDYETYYNAIIAEWGSVQNYLLSIVDGKDDPAANGWRAFVGWLGENAPVWGAALAVALVIIVILCGRAVVNKVMKWMNARKKDVYSGMNAISEAQIAQGKALLKLLGESPMTEEERAEIERTNARLKGE